MALKRTLVWGAERLCHLADRWEFTAGLVGCRAQGTGRCLALRSCDWDERWNTEVWR